MKQDEYNMILGVKQVMHPKRRSFLLNKWWKKGWLKDGNPTLELGIVKHLIENKKELMDKWEGRVIIAHFMQSGWNLTDVVGILEDHGDNGWHFFTTGTCSQILSSYYVEYKDIAYIELHPKPDKTWRRLNYLAWKNGRFEDRFHKKITTMSPGTTCHYDFTTVPPTFTYSNPHGKVGECYPDCQCKFLKFN